MRLRDAIPVADILRLVRQFLVTESDATALALIDSPHSQKLIRGIDGPELSQLDSVTFLGTDASLKLRAEIKAALIFCEFAVPTQAPFFMVQVHSIHPVMAILVAALKAQFLPNSFSMPPSPKVAGKNTVAQSAIVEGELEGNVTIGAGSFIGKGSFIGSGTRIEPNVTIQENCVIGRNCIIQSGVVIGSAGFGFYPGEKGLVTMPHLAGVVIGDEGWIGANVVIAAGVLNPTRLGNGCKLDSHVQIAHNVRMGDDCLLASQSGVAGSTVIGDRFQMGGAASVDGHLHIGDDVSVAACSGVTKDLTDKSVVAGFPAQALYKWRLQQIRLRNLDMP